MSEDWTETYRPAGLDEVVGNPKAVQELRAWAQSWVAGKPIKKAAVLMGSPGTGKTSAALALAADFNWDVVEMNASDQRNADAIKAVALRGALGETFSEDGEYLSSKEGNLKLIVLDEADNISGREDRGGIPAIAEVVRSTKQPVILIVNDWYALSRKSSALKSGTQQIKFNRIRTVTVRGVLRRISKDRGIKITDQALRVLSENSNGDLRSAIRDLQAVAMGKQEVDEDQAAVVGFREVEQTMFQVMDDIFKSRDPILARKALLEVDETPDTKLLWIDENLPNAYRDNLDLYRGMKAVARADNFLGRVYRRQHYGFWSYANDFLSFAVCAAKQRDVRGYVRYNFPSYLIRMSRSKGNRALQANISSKLGSMIHMSAAGVRQDFLPPFKQMFQNNEEFRLHMTIKLELDVEEVAFLLDAKIDSAAVKRVMASVKKSTTHPSSQSKKSISPEPEMKKAKDGSSSKPAMCQKRLFSF